MKYLFITLLHLLATISFAQDFSAVKDPVKVKNAIQQKHQQTTSIIADFDEKVITPMLKDAQNGKGKLWYKKSNNVRWENHSNKQTILISGDKVKVFEAGKISTNVATQKIANQIQQLLISMLSGEFLNEKDFSITYMESKTLYQLQLSPRTARMSKYIKSIHLNFSKNTLLLEELTLFESNNQKIIYTFTNLKTNEIITDSKFKYI